ncbi:hypothetical protein BC829DRAFT_400034 [Chytridium lagenaria]|nr:hypothetical protein BC829DRAFT_400034 [Chytridium lagenaria]
MTFNILSDHMLMQCCLFLNLPDLIRLRLVSSIQRRRIDSVLELIAFARRYLDTVKQYDVIRRTSAKETGGGFTTALVFLPSSFTVALFEQDGFEARFFLTNNCAAIHRHQLGEPFAQKTIEGLRRAVLVTKSLLREEVMVRYHMDYMHTLAWAIAANDIELYDGILKYFDKKHLLRYPLSTACYWDRPHFARRLLEIMSLPRDDTLVIEACRGGSIEILEMLLTAGLKHPYGAERSLLDAVERQRLPMVHHLIERKGVNPNTPTVIQAMKKRHYDLADYV